MAVRFDSAEELGAWARAHGVVSARLSDSGALVEACFVPQTPLLLPPEDDESPAAAALSPHEQALQDMVQRTRCR